MAVKPLKSCEVVDALYYLSRKIIPEFILQETIVEQDSFQKGFGTVKYLM
jgi:hypothetical protein